VILLASRIDHYSVCGDCDHFNEDKDCPLLFGECDKYKKVVAKKGVV